MNEYRTGQSSINCEVCGLTHETGPTPDTVCVRALRAQLKELQAAWQAEHAERIRLEEALKMAQKISDGYRDVYVMGD